MTGKAADTRVTIDAKFIKDQAREAVHQFFRPITDPFKSASKSQSKATSSKPRADAR